MFINRKWKFVFVHNPKSAGTSIRNSFNNEGYGILTRTKLFPHNPASVVHQSCGDKTWNEYFKFGFVRNPYDRCVSFYFFHRSDQYSHHVGKQEAQKPFDEWLKQKLSSKLVFDNTKKNNKFIGFGNFVQVPQSVYLDEPLDFIGRYETLEKDYQYVVDKLGVKKTLPHYNKSVDHESWEHYYTDELKELVYNHFKEDFDNFGYAI
jgi:hypothetical protein|tara:strand:- start:496 stop:1113 length:618 start_codon:yes stop_codon:yes gene_type:complete